MSVRPRQRSAWPKCRGWSACRGLDSTNWSGRPSPVRFTTWPVADPSTTSSCRGSASNVRRRNCGIDGKPVLFYARRPLAAPVPKRKPRKATAASDDRHADLVDGLKGLGLVAVTAAQVAEAVKDLYPNGVPEAANGEVLRAVFLHCRRQNSRDNVR